MKPYFDQDGVTLYHSDARRIPLADETVQTCVTSPPYFGLRDYGTRRWEGGDPDCQHEGSERYFTENTAAVSSAGAFSSPGEANAARLKAGRWREGGACVKCGAEHVDLQIGLERTPDAFVSELMQVFREVRRVLRKDGTCWLNMGDTFNAYNGNRGTKSQYAGRRNDMEASFPAGYGLMVPTLKAKDLVGVPWMLAFALRADGWYLRSEIIWHKPSPMPESVSDRPTRAHETVFLLSKSEKYFYNRAEARDPLKQSSVARLGQDVDAQLGSVRANGGGKTNGTMKAVKPACFGGSRKSEINDQTRLASGNEWSQDPEDGANWRDVWTIAHEGFDGAHFATMPSVLAERCVRAGSRPGDMVLDPFNGSGTTGAVSQKWGRRYVGLDLNAEYLELTKQRFRQRPLFGASA